MTAEDLRAELLQGFRGLDADSTGSVSRADFSKLALPVLAAKPSGVKDECQLLKLVDPANSGRVAYGPCLDWLAAPEGQCIQFRQTPYEVPGDSKLLHLKGFAARLRMGEVREIRRALLEFVAALGPTEILWDGDNYAKDSFTDLLPDLLSACGGVSRVRLVAFLRDGDQARFQDAWVPLGLPITVWVVSSSIDFTELGRLALQETQSDTVVCFGGGATTKGEYERVPQNVAWHLFPVSRPTADGGNMETSSLLASSHEKNVLIHDVKPPDEAKGS